MLIFALSSKSYAHDIPISKIHIIPDKSEIHLQLVINSFELSFLSEIDQNHNGYIDRKELDAKRSLIKKRLLSALKIVMDETAIQAESTGIMLNGQNHHLIFRAHYPKKQGFKSLKLISKLEQITSKSQITQVTYGSSGHEQKARLETGSNAATFGMVRNHKVKGFWSSVFHYQTILLLGGIGLIIIGGVYAARKRLLTNIKPEH